MTVSQRNALANSWLEEQEREAGVPAGTMRRNSRSKTDATLGETEEMSDSSSEEAQKDPVETWMLMVSQGLARAQCAALDLLNVQAVFAL